MEGVSFSLMLKSLLARLLIVDGDLLFLSRKPVSKPLINTILTMKTGGSTTVLSDYKIDQTWRCIREGGARRS